MGITSTTRYSFVGELIELVPSEVGVSRCPPDDGGRSVPITFLNLSDLERMSDPIPPLAPFSASALAFGSLGMVARLN